MARSYGAVKVSVWEVSSDFRRLELDAQWGYMMLISQPQLNNLGVLPYAPEKWHRFAAGLTHDHLDAILEQLAEQRYIVVDANTDELLVRTFIKHDKVWLQPKLVTNARKLIREVESHVIRDALTVRHPWLLDTRDRGAIEQWESDPQLWTDTPSETPLGTPSETPIPTRARPGPGPGPGVAGDLEAVSRAAATHARTEPEAAPDDAAAAEVLEQLEAQHIHLSAAALELATADPPRAQAWLQVAASEATTNPAGFVLAGLRSGEWPSPRTRAQAPPVTTNGSGRGVGYVRGLIDNGVIGQMFELDEELGHVSVTDVEREQLRARIRERFTHLEGHLLPADELEHQLEAMGAGEDELVGLLELAADLRSAV